MITEAIQQLVNAAERDGNAAKAAGDSEGELAAIQRMAMAMKIASHAIDYMNSVIATRKRVEL